jgi:ankyrin repeat protein
MLLAHGADVNSRGYYGTALMQASRRDRYDATRLNKFEIVALLLDHGADVNTWNKYNETALIHTSHSNNTAIVRLLLAHGAVVNARDDDNTPRSDEI